VAYLFAIIGGLPLSKSQIKRVASGTSPIQTTRKRFWSFWESKVFRCLPYQPRLIEKLPEKYTGISKELAFKQTNVDVEIIAADS